ncbi:Cytidylate kinase-domain-containing protein [Catenaria anguillulae PL171]|uniref:(d)CMP kinase n=1 Tax=Catenaria anguillulae PL171 TaxID=765915 RepID=A0A1Y2HXJ6_9FUNG|nr:Cytidylate kinase-domain-containing protein [Catenaria anguillulae PL171]
MILCCINIRARSSSAGTAATAAFGTPIQVAIDGPAASGKSSTAQLVAARLGFSYIDSGALSAAFITLKALNSNPTRRKTGPPLSGPPTSPSRPSTSRPILARLARFARRPNCFSTQGRDAGHSLTSRTRHVSEIAAIPAVRSALLVLKRRLASEANVVMDGRDIGTSVFPDAKVKVYLDASPEVRARRRLAELMGAGQGNSVQMGLEEMVAELRARDLADTQRKESPLRCAEDAVRLDTSAMTQAEVVERIVRLVEEKVLARPQ